MRYFSTVFVLLVVIGLTFAQPVKVQAAVNEDFESYSLNVLAETLTNPNVSFDGGNGWYVGQVSSGSCVSGKILVDYISLNPLIMDFPSPQQSYSMGYITHGSIEFWVWGYLNGQLVFTNIFQVGDCGSISPNGGIASGAGIVFDRLVVRADFPLTESAIDNLVTTDANSTYPTMNVPHISQIRINASSPVTPYDGPAGSPVRLANGNTFMLPQDFDGNGYDTHIVTGTAVVDGITWYSIFIGNENFVWVRSDQVKDAGPNPQ